MIMIFISLYFQVKLQRLAENTSHGYNCMGVQCYTYVTCEGFFYRYEKIIPYSDKIT